MAATATASTTSIVTRSRYDATPKTSKKPGSWRREKSGDRLRLGDVMSQCVSWSHLQVVGLNGHLNAMVLMNNGAI